MCRTIQALLQTVVCTIQMLVRMVMTLVLMMEAMLRMVLQTIYNFISVVLQMISLLPICLVFLITSRVKCLMCGGGCDGFKSGGRMDCLISILLLVAIFYILRATGYLDKILARMGYSKDEDEVDDEGLKSSNASLMFLN